MTDWNPCQCGHTLYRHDMGHGCIDCGCRGFAITQCYRDEHEWVQTGGPGDEWLMCLRCDTEIDA